MTNSRRGYMVLFVVSLLFLIFTGSLFVLLVCVGELLLPLILFIRLRYEAEGVRLKWESRGVCTEGQEISLLASGKSGRTALASGMIQAEVEYKNRLLGVQSRQFVQLPSGTRFQSAAHLRMELCGDAELDCCQAALWDLFGLCQVRLEKPVKRTIVVYPDEVMLHLTPETISGSMMEGEQDSLPRTGNDLSETLELREYRPGDDVRAIHWKLSEKLQKLLMREPGDTAQPDMLLLFDAGQQSGERAWDKKLLSDCVALGTGLSWRLQELGVAYRIGIPAAGRLNLFQVTGVQEFRRMMDIWMGTGMQEQSGMGLQYWLTDPHRAVFARILYVTAGEVPEELSHLPVPVDMTAVCLNPHGEQPGTNGQPGCRVINLSPEHLREFIQNIRF